VIGRVGTQNLLCLYVDNMSRVVAWASPWKTAVFLPCVIWAPEVRPTRRGGCCRWVEVLEERASGFIRSMKRIWGLPLPQALISGFHSGSLTSVVSPLVG
jgi:hypothetical protein